MHTKYTQLNPDLIPRLRTYRAQRFGAPAAAAVTAAAAWTITDPQQAGAVVNTFQTAGFSANLYFSRLGLVTFSGSGSAGSRWSPAHAASGPSVGLSAQGSGLDFVGDSVSQSAPISTSNNFPVNGGLSYNVTVSNTIIPLRAQTAGGQNFFGWIRIDDVTNGSYTIGFSDQPDTGVLAGTTTEVGAAAVPEPSTALPLLLLGAAGVVANRRRQMKTEAQAAS